MCRYVERNALRAGLVERAEDWRWCSLWRRRQRPTANDRPFLLPPVSWPVEPPTNWLAVVNRPESEAELDSLRKCVQRGAPYGNPDWQHRTALRLGLESSLRPRGRPPKSSNR
ncbi:MAG: hypothetical protein HY718_05145 [Planctomycetes bacterium]|nr:hypothetical protein [Planctomycetota bacterium]